MKGICPLYRGFSIPYNGLGPVVTAHPGSPRQNAAGRGTATTLTTTTTTTTGVVCVCVCPIADMSSLLRHPAAPFVVPSAAEGADRGVCSRASERDMARAGGATVRLSPKNAPPRRAGNGDTRRECPTGRHYPHHANI